MKNYSIAKDYGVFDSPMAGMDASQESPMVQRPRISIMDDSAPFSPFSPVKVTTETYYLVTHIGSIGPRLQSLENARIIAAEFLSDFPWIAIYSGNVQVDLIGQKPEDSPSVASCLTCGQSVASDVRGRHRDNDLQIALKQALHDVTFSQYHLANGETGPAQNALDRVYTNVLRSIEAIER